MKWPAFVFLLGVIVCAMFCGAAIEERAYYWAAFYAIFGVINTLLLFREVLE